MSRGIPECADCGAQMQEIRMIGEAYWRCPWAKPWDWVIETHTIPKRLTCGGVPFSKRIVGGMTISSVP